MEETTRGNKIRQPLVAVVILNWNGRYFLEKFLPSVYNSTYPNIRFVIGDNGSTDDSCAFIAENYPSVELIRNTSNLGFAEGYNQVLSRVDADYYVLLNSDVEVTPGWIEPLVALMEDQPDIAAAQPKIRSFHQRDKFEHAGAAGGFIDAFGFPFCRGRVLHETEVDAGQYDDVCDVFWATGAALFVRRICWEQVGGFDGDFFAHMEEIDFCWRLQSKGHRIVYCPDAVVYHVGGGTLPKSNPHKTYLNFRNNLFMMQKNLAFGPAFVKIFFRFWFDLAALLHFVSKGDFRDAAAVSKAHRAFLAALFYTAKKRKSPSTLTGKKGYYAGSMIWDFYVLGKRKFSAILPNIKKNLS